MKLKQVSNKNLRVLLITVLFISIVSTIITLNMLKLEPVTGAATGAADVDLTISNYIAVTVEGSIDFGAGRVDDANGSAELDASPAGSVINGTWADINQSIRIKNEGNIMINVSVKASQDASSWIGPKSEAYFIPVNATNDDGCGEYLVGRTLYNGTMWVQNRTAWTMLNATYKPVCTNLSRGTGNPPTVNDEVNMTIRLIIEKQLQPGEKIVTLTFLGDDY